YSFIFSAVQLLAFSAFFEPVSRGPITSERYWRFLINWVLALISLIRAWSRSAGLIALSARAAVNTVPATRGVAAGWAADSRVKSPRRRQQTASRTAATDQPGRERERGMSGLQRERVRRNSERSEPSL